MKRYYTLLFLLAAFTMSAQEPIEVNVENRPSSLGIQPAFEVRVPQAAPDDAIDLWKKTIIPSGLFKKSPKMKKEKDEWVVNDLVLEEVSSSPMDVITQVSSFPGHLYVRVFMQTENGFLGADSSRQTDAAIALVRDYGVELYRHAVEKELKAEENHLKSLEKDLEKLGQRNKSYDRKKAEAEREKSTLQEEARYQEEILQNEREVLSDDPNAARETVKDELKATEKEIKKARRTASRYDKKGRKNEQDQKNKVREIEKQRDKVAEVEAKLENIR